MARYRMSDGMVVDTDRASATAELAPRPGQYGRVYQTLYRSRRGRWYLVSSPTWTEDGRSGDRAEWLSNEEACRLLLTASVDISPWPELAELADKMTE